ncbi:alpha/beta-hydrolase [Penicillium odoratum]|uniref:alpha/beta-hydrolase n=1 Tax=Penicillium odoratum TaxID=1167516 RepID=UPI002546CA94|nr:alpha/beta-hydrolase [Penicillium odoratum]KAJ5753035.1 alpha/beta-hydrolase [Penicillium odoratum]
MASRQSDISRVEVSVVLPTKTIPSYEQRVIGELAEIEGIEEFRGIPYGIVPARWQHAVLRDKLPEDIFHATKNGPRCPQPQEPNNSDFYQSHLDFPDVTESEFDCLNLFITRPSASALTAAGISTTAKLPVYVYIHGGAYSFGAGTDPMWNPARLVKKSIELGTPIIVATINYRLHMFGFGAASEIIARSRGCNFGLTDQRTAIRWVHQNIDAFGGNVDQVTVGGQSAGGSSSHAHILEAVFGDQKPLVQRGIIQSGAVGVLGPISMHVANERWNALCAQLNAPDSSRLEYMMNVPTDKIIKACHDLGWMVSPLVVDGFTISEKDERWRIHLDGTENPNYAQSVDSAPIAVLIGDTDLEGTVHADSVSKINSFTQLQEILDQVKSREFLDKFYRLYNLQPDTPLPSLHEQILHFLSDLQFGYPVQLARDELIKSTARPTVVQSYRANFGNPFPGPNYQKAQHCVDLIYIYDAFAEALRAVDEALPVDAFKNEALVERMQADWIRFIADPVTSSQDGLATIYNADRTTSTVDMAVDPEWVARKERFKVLTEYPIAAQQALKALSGFGHSF